MRLGWDYIEHQVKTDPKTGQKIYLINSTFDPKNGLGSYWQSNPASTFGQFVDSVVTWYPYSGDNEAIDVVRTMLGLSARAWNDSSGLGLGKRAICYRVWQ